MSLESVEVVVRGYRAFIDGDFEAIAELLDPEVEWYPLDAGAAVVRRPRRTSSASSPSATGSSTASSSSAASARATRSSSGSAPRREMRDPDDERPLQSRRKFSVERYSAVVTIRDGRVVRVQDFPHLDAAFEAAGIDPEHR